MHSGAAGAAAAAVAVAWVAWQRSRTKRIDRTGKTVVELLPGETSALMMDTPAISTVTFFSGDHAKAAEFLRGRLAEIVLANPWLQGVLDRQRGDARPVLVHGEKDEGASPAFVHATPGDVALSRGTPYATIARTVGRLLVKKGDLCVGRGCEPQFRVSLVPDAAAPGERWALVVSMSHVIADGHTFYKIHNMLCAAEPVQALVAQRQMNIPAAAAEAMGGAANAGFLQFPKPGLLLKVVIAMLGGKLFGPAGGVLAAEVDTGFVARQKTAALAEKSVPFVSTNDVITSAVLSASGCDIGTMDINFRGRIAGCKDQFAGNYEDKIIYRAADVATPALVRTSILSASALHRASQPPTLLPTSVLDFLRSGMITFVTNWASFARDAALPSTCGSAAELHLPIFEPADVPVRAFAGGCIFRAAPGIMGIVILGPPAILDAISCCGVLGRKLNLAI